MGGEKHPGLDAVRDEHTRRLFEMYKEKNGAFHKTMTLLTGFALAFLFLVLLPYFSIQTRMAGVSARLGALAPELETVGREMKTFRQAHEGIRELGSRIASGPGELREFLMRIGDGSEDGPWQTAQQTDFCLSVPGEERLNCRVAQWLQGEFDRYRGILQDKVVGPLEERRRGSAAPVDVSAMKQGLRTLEDRLRQKAAENPEFWRTFSGKEAFFSEMGETFDLAWREYGDIIEGEGKRLGSQIETMQAERGALEKTRIALQAEEERISGRIHEIESPLGKLPVGLEESVAVFPVLLAIGYFVAVSRLIETLRLRRAFRKLYQEKDPDRKVITDEQVALVAPVFIDSLNPHQNRLVQGFLLLIPFLAFLAACTAVISGWRLHGKTAVIEPLGPDGWIVLYFGSFAVFLACTAAVFREAVQNRK